MNRAGKQHPLETAVELGASLTLAAAIGWAIVAAGMSLTVAATAVVAAFIAGLAAMRLSGGDHRLPMPSFEPAAVETVEPRELDELLLEHKDQVLLLDDPIEGPDPASRVVRLFAQQEATPGELVNRIADFLGDGRGTSGTVSLLPIPEATQPDATAALHEALANIRASLR